MGNLLQHTGRNTSGISLLLYKEIEYIDSIPEPVDFNIETEVILVEDEYWNFIELSLDDRSFKINEIKSESGILYQISVEGFLAGETNLTAQEKAKLSTGKFNGIAQDNDSQSRYLGTLDVPMLFSFPVFNTNSTIGESRKGTKVIFSGTFTTPPPFYQGFFQVAESIDPFPATGDFITLYNMILADRVRLTNLESGKENKSEKNTENGYVGIDLWRIKFRSYVSNVWSFFTNSSTDVRYYQFQDKSYTIAGMDDIGSSLDEAKAYADSLVVGLWDDRGNFDASVNAYPSSGGSGTAGAILKGDIWTISVAGTLPTSQVVEVGDTVRALTNTPGNTQSNWSIQQNNIGYTPENSANKTETVTGNETSTTKYLSIKGVYDWGTGLFATITNLALKAAKVTVSRYNSTSSTVYATKVKVNDEGIVTDTAAATTADIGESTDKRYQTDNQQSYNDATSSIQTQLNSKQNSLGFTAENVANKDTDGTLAANSDTKYPSQKAVKTAVDSAKAYADSLVVGLWDDRGNFDASVNAYPSSGGSGTAGAILKGDIWTISVAGTLPTSQVVEVGDTVRALTNTPGNTQSNWSIQQNNIGYTPENSANKDTDGTLSANSDTKYPSQKAVKTYIDAADTILQNQVTANAAAMAAVNPNLAPFQVYLYSNFT